MEQKPIILKSVSYKSVIAEARNSRVNVLCCSERNRGDEILYQII